MRELFLSVLNMSLTASYVILCVVFIRLCLKKAPKSISYALWLVVAFRLIIPFSFESVISLMPRNINPVSVTPTFIKEDSIIQNEILEDHGEFVNLDIADENTKVSQSASMLNLDEISKESTIDYVKVSSVIWGLGVISLITYSFISIIIIKRKLNNAQLIEKNIYEAMNLKTPFVFGIMNPKIYLPIGLKTDERSYILLHEQTHIKRKDHIVKILAFFILSLHWFNPLVWFAYMLMSTDMELSCDEHVLKKVKEEIKKPYANSLLSLATGRHILNANPLAFGEGNIKERIKNVLNYKKSSFWVIALSMIVAIIVGFALISDPKLEKAQVDRIQEKSTIKDEKEMKSIEVDNGNQTVIGNQTYGIVGEDENTIYTSVKIQMFLEQEHNVFQSSDLKIISFINSSIKDCLSGSLVHVDNLENNYTSKYAILFSNNISESSYLLYYDTLYGRAYIEVKGGYVEIDTDFARYIHSLLENINFNKEIEYTDASALFQNYGWTLDYLIREMKIDIGNFNKLGYFNPNTYYFAYNNELSKDIGLDMSQYVNITDVTVEIYRLHESMPEAFYPIEECRGIVLKYNDKIIGAFISAGRHSAFHACSLSGKSFEEVTGKSIHEWLSQKVTGDTTEERLSKLEPYEVIKEYFSCLMNKDAKTAKYCISKVTHLDRLTTNMENSELYNEGISLPLSGSGFGNSSLDNLKSAKLLETELVSEFDNTKIYRVKVDLQYNKDNSSISGEQYWDCYMVYESPQTGWKIEEFGH